MSLLRATAVCAGALLAAGCLAPACVNAGSAQASFTVTATLGPVSGTGSCRTGTAGQVECVTPYPRSPAPDNQKLLSLPASGSPSAVAISAVGGDCLATLAWLGWALMARNWAEWRPVLATYQPLDRVQVWQPESLCRWDYQAPFAASWAVKLVQYGRFEYLETTLSW